MDQMEMDLIRRCLDGDKEAFRPLYEAAYARARAAVSRVLADPDEVEDAVQDAFVRAYTRLGLFDGRCEFAAWVCAIAVNVARRRCSRLAMEPLALPEEDLESGRGTREDAAVVAEKAAVRLDLRAAIGRLSPRQQHALALRYVDGLAHREIAAALGCSEATARSTLRHALHYLRKELRERLEEGG